MGKADAAAGYACEGCGTRVRDDWYRCPRCRSVLSGPTPTFAAVTSPSVRSTRRGRPILIGMLAALIVAPIAAVVVEDRRTQALQPAEQPSIETPTRPRQAAAEVARDTATAPRQPDVDAAALVARVASDAMRWGDAAFAQGDFALARVQYEAAIATGPRNAEAWNKLGEIHLREGRTMEANRAFGEAIDIDPSRWTYRFNRARARGLQRQWHGAVEDYRAAAARNPRDDLTHYGLGLALIELGSHDAAARAIERAVALAPERTGFLVTLGTAYAAAGDERRAREAFQRFLDRSPEHYEAPRVRGLLTSLEQPSR